MSTNYVPQESYTVRCSCGKRARVEPKSFGVEKVCEKCRIPFRVEWSAQGTPRMVYLADPPPPPPGRAPAPKSAPARDVELVPNDVCACGQHLIVRPEWAGRAVKCPACGVVMRFERVRDSKAKEVTMRRLGPSRPKPAPRPASKSAPKVSPGKSSRSAPETKKTRGRKSGK